MRCFSWCGRNTFVWFYHPNWDGSRKEDKTASTVETVQIIFPSHIIYLTETPKGGKKILTCLPICHSLCAHPSWVHLLIWSCHRPASGDRQHWETDDVGREGSQLTVSVQWCSDTQCVAVDFVLRGVETLQRPRFQWKARICTIHTKIDGIEKIIQTR